MKIDRIKNALQKIKKHELWNKKYELWKENRAFSCTRKIRKLERIKYRYK